MRWFRAHPLALAAVAVGVLVVAATAVVSVRRNAVWRERAHVADSTAKAAQRDRARILQRGAADSALAASLGISVVRLTDQANRAAHVAAEATFDAQGYRKARDAAIARLRRTATPSDSIAALVAEAAASDSLIASQQDVIAAKDRETTALRSAVDSGTAARVVLASALDSARAQLRRDGAVIQSLQSVVRAARPASAPRFAKLALTAGVGACASPGLTLRPCAFVGAGPSIRIF
jgi:hypothetical protein